MGERFSAPKRGAERLVQLQETWNQAVEAVARARWEAWREEIKGANPYWPAWDDRSDDGSGMGEEYRAAFWSEAQEDLLAAVEAADTRPAGFAS